MLIKENNTTGSCPDSTAPTFWENQYPLFPIKSKHFLKVDVLRTTGSSMCGFHLTISLRYPTVWAFGRGAPLNLHSPIIPGLYGNLPE